MANLKVTSSTTKAGKELFKLGKQRGRTSFRVGVFGSDDSKQVIKGVVHENGAEIKVTQKMRGYFLAVFGIPLKLGSVIKIPARKWLTLAYERNINYFAKLIKINMTKVAEGKLTVKESNDIISIALASATKEELGVNMPPKLKNREGTPLVDTGDLRRSIGTKIVTSKGITKTKGYGEN